MNEQSEPPHPPPFEPSEDIGDLSDGKYDDPTAAARFAGASLETELISLEVKV